MRSLFFFTYNWYTKQSTKYYLGPCHTSLEGGSCLPALFVVLFCASMISVRQNDAVIFDNEKNRTERMWKKENDDVMMQ